MRIAHINNMANVAWTLARAQKRLGHEAVVFSVYEYPSRFPYDVAGPPARGPVFLNAGPGLRLAAVSPVGGLHLYRRGWGPPAFFSAF